MTSLDRAIITRKLQAMVRYLNALKPYATSDQQAYLDNFEQQLIVERLLQLIVQTAIDINLQLLLSLTQPIPEDYFGSFIKVSRNGILSQALAQRLAPSTGLRNRLVHQYEEIDSRIVWRSIPLTLELYPQYIQQVQVYLEQQNAP